MADPRRAIAERLAAMATLEESESMFGPRMAYWVNGKEVAHFESESVIEVRLTKAVIRGMRADFKADPRIELRPSGADWITVTFASPHDVAFVVELVGLAEQAHRPPDGTVAKPAPTGADLECRRRFH